MIKIEGWFWMFVTIPVWILGVVKLIEVIL